MRLRQILFATALAGALLGGVAAAATDPDTAALARVTLTAIDGTPANKDAVLDAINRATRGAELAVITEAVCQLSTRRDLNEIAQTPEALLQAQATLGREEVREALSEACEVAQLALASYGATGGVPAGGAPGQAFGSGAIGAPGGGGGSGYKT